MTILLASVVYFLSGAVIAFAIGFWLGRQIPDRINIGEALLQDAISARFIRPHLLLNNVTLKTDIGTTQIDHILVADTGVFVIESKHYTGWIFGDPRQSHWTQVIYKRQSKFANPIHQNYGHVKAVQSLFKLPESNFITLVVFTGDADFKTDLGPAVLKLDDLMAALNADRPVIFDERKMAYIVGRIEMKRLPRSTDTDEYHVNFVRRRIQGRAVARSRAAVNYTELGISRFPGRF